MLTLQLPENEIHSEALKKPDTQAKMVWRAFKRHKLALIGIVYLFLMLLLVILGPIIIPHDPLEQHPDYALGIPQPPSAEYLLGTDSYGRDVLSRLINGAQISLSVGFVAVGISTLIGILLGSLAGYYGGLVDTIITRLADIFLSVPSFFLMMTVNAYMKQSIYNVMIIIGLFSWMSVTRLVRAEFLRLKEMDYISASRALGADPKQLILRHLLPNSMAPVIVSATIGIPSAILRESSLSFLGLGVPPPQASWGNMLFEARKWLNMAWWFWVPPGMLISLTVIAFNFVGDGLRDALDPSLHGR
ncbi:MAG: ABC transporter permease [Chloroflexi bacterium]|nr:ABC transporter permease [Chloroflexota bacterium]